MKRVELWYWQETNMWSNPVIDKLFDMTHLHRFFLRDTTLHFPFEIFSFKLENEASINPAAAKMNAQPYDPVWSNTQPAK